MTTIVPDSAPAGDEPSELLDRLEALSEQVHERMLRLREITLEIDEHTRRAAESRVEMDAVCDEIDALLNVPAAAPRRR